MRNDRELRNTVWNPEDLFTAGEVKRLMVGQRIRRIARSQRNPTLQSTAPYEQCRGDAGTESDANKSQRSHGALPPEAESTSGVRHERTVSQPSVFTIGLISG